MNTIINSVSVAPKLYELNKGRTAEDIEEALNELTSARVVYMQSTASANSANQVYADAMLSTFGGQWWTIADKGVKKVIKNERRLFVEGLESLGFKQGTIDVYWQRVKVACGYVPAGNRASGSTSVDAKTFAELKTMLNRIHGENADSEGCELSRKALENLKLAFIAMGGDLAIDLTK